MTVILGTELGDVLIGIDRSDTILSKAGNDILVGGADLDWLVGSDFNRLEMNPPNEVDILIGGAGGDQFQLGHGAKNGVSYYVGRGNSDYALVTDFSFSEDIITLSANISSRNEVALAA